MVPAPVECNAHSIETEVQSLWKARRLPPQGGVLGPSSGPAVHQFEGAWTQGDFPSLIARRALAADIDARYLSLVGRRAGATLRQGSAPGRVAPSAIPALLTSLGIWVGGDGRTPWDAEDRTAGVQTIVGRLASKGILVSRDEAFRLCPTCGAPRSPERILYNEQEGDTFLVRFPVQVGASTANALVWVDAPWKLLGTSALLVNPDQRYVVAAYRRRDDRELILSSKSSLARLRAWIPEAEFEVVEERTGRELQGLPYAYPLRHEFPMGGDLSPPSGTILAASDVGDSGTGIVPLVPGHGPTDARIAAQVGVTGWPLVTTRGKLDFTLMHKYAGLDLDTTNEFVERDLSEAGALLARLRVKRGVPHCTLCGTPLLWVPGRAWCLESSRLPVERRTTFSRLLPRESLPGQMEVAPWPVSEATPTEDAGAIALLECAGCNRLEAPEGPTACPCGGTRSLVHRRLLPSSGAAFSAWARFDPFPDGDSVHLYVGQRRRVPSVVNHLAALSGIEGSVGEVSLTVVPTVTENDMAGLVRDHGADAVRAALVRSGPSEASGGRLASRCRQEARRIRRWWMLSREVLASCDPGMLATFARPIGGFLSELEAEDRAVLARWERTRVLALSHYDQGEPNLVHRRAFRFLDNDLVLYHALVQPRLALAGTPTTKRAALRTLAHLLQGTAEVLAPILPFTSEALHRSFSENRTSLFEQPSSGLDRSLLNDDLFAAWDRWGSVLRSVDRFRRSIGVSRSTVLPSVALVLSADDAAGRFREDREVLARLARVQRLDIGSPKEPWTGRQRTLRPIEAEIQKAYGSQASQVIHLLQRLPARRWEAALGQEELSVVINGLPRKVWPSMVALSDTLPERVVPVPWALGEMYAEMPSGESVSRRATPPLSPDAFWLVRRLKARLRPLSGAGLPRPAVAIVTAKDPLASELRAAAEPLARYLELSEFRVMDASEGARPPNALLGRTRTGDRWSVHVPDLPARPLRQKHRPPATRMPRVTVAVSDAPPAVKEFDYADPAYIAHEQEVRVLGQELDGLIGIPLLGPSKVALAWDHGVHSVDELRQTPFDTLASFPGFGGPVAAAVVLKLGGSVPPAPPRPVRPSASVRAAPAPIPEVPPVQTVPSESPIVVPVVDRSLAQVAPSVLVPAAEPLREEPAPLPEPAPEPHALEPLATEGPAVDTGAASSPPVSDEEGPVVPASPQPTESQETKVAEEPLLPGSAELAEPPAETPPETVSTPSPPPPEDTVPPEPSPPAPELVLPEEATAAPEPSRFPGTERTAPPEPEPVPEAQTATSAPAESLPEEQESPPSPGPGSEPEPGSTVSPSPDLDRSIPSNEAIEPTEVVEPVVPSDLPQESPAPEPSLDVNTVPEHPEALEPTGDVPVPFPQPEVVPSESVQVPTESVDSVPPSTEASAPPSEREEPPGGVAEASPVTEAPLPPAIEAEPPTPEVSAEAPSTEPAPSPSPTEALATPEIVPEALSPAPPPGPTPAGEVPPRAPASPVAPTVRPPPVVPAFVPAPPELLPPVPPSGVELAVGDSIVSALNDFLESAAAGHHGVCVVRESPERIRARVGSRPIEVIWLTNIGRGPALRPSDLEGVFAFLCRKLLEERVTAFFLEGIEYLVRLHGADAVLTGLVEFDRLTRENDARVWVYLAPALMKPADIERFRGTFGARLGSL